MKTSYVSSRSFCLALLCSLFSVGCSISAALHGMRGPSSLIVTHKIYLDMTTVTITEGSVVILNVALDQIQPTDTVINLNLSSSSVYSRFNPLPTQITILAGQLSKGIILNTIDDSISQPQETWTLTVSPVDTSLGADPGQLVITLNDNDSGGTTPQTSGLVQLKEFNPFPNAVTSINFKNRIYFSNTDAAHGMELWVSDGTIIGTTLLKDINPGQESSDPANYYIDENGTYLYFTATTPSAGLEIWRTDGTVAGTILLKDIEPGATGSSPAFVFKDGGTVYFVVSTSLYGREIWITDGTAAGTQILKDIAPGASGVYSYGTFIKYNSKVYFGVSRADTSYVAGIWETDGTPAGTVLAVDKVGATNLYYYPPPNSFVAVGNKLVFQGGRGDVSTELFATDLTNAGTVLLKDYNSGFVSSYPTPTNYVVNGRNFVYVSFDSDATKGLNLTDGTPGGTSKVAAAATPSSILGMIGTNIIFNGYSSASDYELWTSDGTNAGTILLKDIYPGTTGGVANGSSPSFAAQIGNKIFFTATNSTEGLELYVTDGTPVGTIILKDINPGSGSSSPTNFVVVNSLLYFRAYSPTSGSELWVSDGTPAGTQLFKDINSGVGSSGPTGLVNVNNTHLFFTAYNPVVNFGTVYISDLTSAGTFAINHALVQSLNSETKNIVGIGNTAYFDAMNSSTSNPLWKSDGTSAGTVLLSDLNPNINCSDINYMLVSNTSLFFSASSPATGNEVFISDGTTAGTTILKDITPGTISSSPGSYVKVANNNVFFVATTSAEGRELWFTDGTTGNTKLVKDIFAGTNSSSPQYLTAIPGTNSIVFLANTGGSTYDVFVSDGTTAGTVALGISNVTTIYFTVVPTSNSVIIAVADSSASSKLRFYNLDLAGPSVTLLNTTYTTDQAVRGTGSYYFSTRLNLFFYFASDVGLTTIKLWKSDGTAAGTTVVTTIPSNGNNFNFNSFADTGTKLTFQYINRTYSSVIEMWTTDGTAANTNVVTTFTESYTVKLVSGGKIYLTAPDAVNGTELWKSDGTSAGTYMLKDIYPGLSSSSPDSFVSFNGKIYFSANDGVHGIELWETDGTTGGTLLLYDINPGSGGSSPVKMTVVGTKLFFYAYKVLSGNEVWVYSP